MGSPKALLAYRGTTFLEWLAELFAAAELEPLLVVLGHEHERIERAVKLPPSARVLVNENYRLGQLSSLQVAVRYLGGAEAGGLLVAPVDHPCLSREVLQKLLAAFAASEPDIVIPTFNGRRGHPVIFSARLFPELLEAPLDEGARVVVHRHAVREVPVPDEGVLADIDDPALYQRWIKESDADARG